MTMFYLEIAFIKTKQNLNKGLIIQKQGNPVFLNNVPIWKRNLFNTHIGMEIPYLVFKRLNPHYCLNANTNEITKQYCSNGRRLYNGKNNAIKYR